MNEPLVTQFGAPDAPYCDPATARVTIIPAPLEYSVCYMKGTNMGRKRFLMPPARWNCMTRNSIGAPSKLAYTPAHPLTTVGWIMPPP